MEYQIVVQEEEPRKGPWLEEEDERLISAVSLLGERRWDSLAKASGLRRNGKSCRLRWMNYLRPHLKHGGITAEEEQIIVQLHKQWGNKWSRIARRLPGRTDNEIKNYWRSHLRKKAGATKQVSFEKQDLVAPKWDYYVCDKDDISGTSADSSNNAFELSNLAISSSPYETRLSDWVSCLSSEQNETRHQGGFCSLGSCFCCLSCSSSEVGDSRSMWNSSGLLWDMG